MSASVSVPNGVRPVLSILIVNFNSTELLRDCLDSIAASTIAERLETIVVDNASVDFDSQQLARRYPWVVWLPQSTNTTYTGGNNIAFSRSTADLVLMLNPDTKLEPEAVERAVRHMDASPDLAGLGAYLIGADGALQRYYRRLPTVGDLPVILFEPIFGSTRRGRRFLMLEQPFDRPTPVGNIPGAFLLLRRSAIRNGLLDPGYFNFVSDLELCARLNRAGRVLVFPDVRCHHLRAGAGVGTDDLRRRLVLYQDLTWGLRRYFATRTNAIGNAGLNLLLIAYWAVRLTRAAAIQPKALPHGVAIAIAALAGSPPRYAATDRALPR